MCSVSVTPARRTPSIMARNWWVNGKSFRSKRSCAISSQRASLASSLARPLASAVCEVCTVAAWT
jgi:hypothetical protein